MILKKITGKIKEILNLTSDKINPSIFIAIFVVVLLLSKNASFNQVIIFGVITGVAMLIYTIKSILKHENITKTLIYLIFGVMAIFIIIAYYYKSKGIDFNIFVVVFPILMMTFFIVGYIDVKKSGDKYKIKQAKKLVIFAIPFFTLITIFCIYILLF